MKMLVGHKMIDKVISYFTHSASLVVDDTDHAHFCRIVMLDDKQPTIVLSEPN